MCYCALLYLNKVPPNHADFVNGNFVCTVCVHRWLMSPKPADRPSARQVLTSDLLPPRLEDEQLKDLLRSLPDNEIAYERVVDSLFSISTSREPQAAGLGPSPSKAGSGGGSSTGTAAAAARAVQSVTPARAATGVEGLHGAGLLSSQQGALPLGELPGAPVDAHLDKEDDVVRVVKEAAGLHGAVQMSSAMLGLSHLGMPRDAVRFLAPSGAVVALRYEVRYPLAAWFAQQAALASSGSSGGYFSNGFGSGGLGLGGGAFGAASTLEHGLKRLEVCRVQRAARGGRGLPASYLTADFDVISPSGVGTGGAGRERLLAEAEVVKVVTQVGPGRCWRSCCHADVNCVIAHHACAGFVCDRRLLCACIRIRKCNSVDV